MTKAQQKLTGEADELRIELKRLTDRRLGLTAETEEARAALDAAQSAFIDGDTAAGDEATRLQALITSRTGAIEAAGRRAEGVQATIEAAEQAARVEEAKEDMLRLSKEAASAKQEYEAAYVELGSRLEQLAGKLTQALTQWQESAKQFQALHDELTEETSEGGALMQEIEGRGGDLTPVLEQAERWRNIPAHRYAPPEAGPYASVVEEALRRAGQKAFERDQQERRRQREARRQAAA